MNFNIKELKQFSLDAQGSYATGITPYFCKAFISTTRVFLNRQFSLNVSPSINTLDWAIIIPARAISKISWSTIHEPIPSLIRRPASTTCG